MVSKRTPATSTVLIIGEGLLVAQIVHRLVKKGISKITVIGKDDAAIEEHVQFLHVNTASIAVDDPDLLLAFDLVIVVDQARDLEIACSESRWPDDRPLIVMRCLENNCKMRSQYRDLELDNGTTAHFVSLPMELLPWTDDKRTNVAKTIEQDLPESRTALFEQYLSAAMAVIKYQETTGKWPSSAESDQILVDLDLAKASENIVRTICESGLSAVHETLEVQSTLVVADAVRLLTGTEQPINNTSIQDAIKIVTAHSTER